MRIPLRWAGLATAVMVALAAAAEAQWTWTPQTRRWINIKHLPKETAELQIEYARSLMLKGEYKEALRETDRFQRYFADSGMADENQFLRGEIRMAQGKLQDAAKEFQRVLSEYPATTLYADAIAKQYEIGDRYYEKGLKRLKKWWIPLRKRPLKHAIKVYSMVIENQPFTLAAAEAQYKLGLCHAARKEYVEAAYEYRRVIEDYSDSDWVDEASYGLAVCYYDASLPHDYDQTSSEMSVESVDDFLFRYHDDPRVEELKAKRQEMRDQIAAQRLKSAQFYEKRREFNSARIYYQVLIDEFGDTPSSKTARAWLEAHPIVETDARKEISALRGKP